MTSRLRPLRRWLFATVVLAAGAFAAYAAWGERRAARELLPDGAGIALEAWGAASILERLEDTQFATAFLAGPTYAWIERTEVVRALDEVRAQIGRTTGFTPSRRHLLDLAGSDCVAAWYPATGAGADGLTGAPWLAAGRLSLRAWAIAAAGRIARQLGLGSGLPREEVAGSTVFTLGDGADALHLFVAGRLFVAGNDRDLVRRAARLAAGSGSALIATAAWARVFAALPARGDLRLWVRGDLVPQRDAAAGPARGAGCFVSTGSPVIIEAFVDGPESPARKPGVAGRLPQLALALPAPLFFHSEAGPLPRALADLLDERAAAVARRRGVPAPQPLGLGRGFALAVTSAEEGGLFPRPQGVAAIGMPDAEAARRALHLLFPAGVRTAAGRWGEALVTRESLPLAGEFELWGAAADDRLVFATQAALIEALEPSGTAGGSAGTASATSDPTSFDSVTTLNMTRLLPALRRYALPLAGLLRARYRGVPDLSRDFELLASLRSVGVTTDTSAAGIRARITLEVGDLPAAR